MWTLASSPPPTRPPAAAARPSPAKPTSKQTTTNNPSSTSAATTTTTTSSSSHRRLIRSLSRSGKLEEALTLLESSSPPRPDPDTYSLILHSIITARSLSHGERLHRHFLRSAPHLLRRHPVLKAKLITLYSVCGRLDAARRVFDGEVLVDDALHRSAWVAMSVAYSRSGFPRESLLVFVEMLFRSVPPDNFAFSSAVKACSELSDPSLGRAVHAQVLKSGGEADQVLYNALLRFYVLCGRLVEALQLFDQMPRRNVVSWNSLLGGFFKVGRLSESLGVFRRMQGGRMVVGFTWVTLTTVLSVCSRLTALRSGKEVHAQIVRARARSDILVVNALMDLYAKCGEVELCKRVFERMPERDLTSWNVMLTGYAVNGCAKDALELFDRMIGMGFRPDGVTFISLLSSCSHAGFAEEGRALFDRMKKDFGVSPRMEHYACFVDLLGRAGRMGEALDIVERMPMKPGGSVWGSLLNSCRLHGDIEVGEIVAKRLFELEPDNAGNYVMLSNMYASAKRWEEAKYVREAMEVKGINKEVGCSWIQVRNNVRTFVAGGSVSLCNSPEYKRVSKELTEAMEAAGYAPDTAAVLHDVGEETKEAWICGHSERIALVFGLMHSGRGTPIRIVKNLRVCPDCHNAMKIVSRVARRLIVLRDTNRFHHFRNGACSCRDFWGLLGNRNICMGCSTWSLESRAPLTPLSPGNGPSKYSPTSALEKRSDRCILGGTRRETLCTIRKQILL